MRKFFEVAIIIALSSVVACGEKTVEGPVDTTLPNGTGSVGMVDTLDAASAADNAAIALDAAAVPLNAASDNLPITPNLESKMGMHDSEDGLQEESSLQPDVNDPPVAPSNF